MALEKETRFRVFVDCDVEVPESDISIILAKLGKHLKTAPYVKRVNGVNVQSYEAIKESRDL